MRYPPRLSNPNRSDLFKLLALLPSALATASWQSSLPWVVPEISKTRCSDSCQLLYSLPSLCKECSGACLWRVSETIWAHFMCIKTHPYPVSTNPYVCLCRCANPNDQNVSILQVSDLPKNRYQRRFTVKAFQFMDQKTNKYLDEEVSIWEVILGLNGHRMQRV